jgi:hypothetical protein
MCWRRRGRGTKISKALKSTLFHISLDFESIQKAGTRSEVYRKHPRRICTKGVLNADFKLKRKVGEKSPTPNGGGQKLLRHFLFGLFLERNLI